MKSLRYILAVVLVAALAACGGGSPLTLTQENFDKIRDGMSAVEVKAVLGLPTDSKSEPIPIVGGTKTTYTYIGKGAQVTIILKNDTVQSKEGHFSKP